MKNTLGQIKSELKKSILEELMRTRWAGLLKGYDIRINWKLSQFIINDDKNYNYVLKTGFNEDILDFDFSKQAALMAEGREGANTNTDVVLHLRYTIGDGDINWHQINWKPFIRNYKIESIGI